MYMVSPHIWELVKKCVNEHEQKVLDNLNRDITDVRNQSRISTSSLIHNLSSRDITPLNPSLSSINLSKPEIPRTPQDEINISDPSYHRSKDRSRSFIDPNLSLGIEPLNVSQIPLPDDSFGQPSFNPINLTQPSNKSNRSQINLTGSSFKSNESFGKLPRPESEYIHEAGEYENFRPFRTSSPVENDPTIPILPLPSCQERQQRSPIKTRSRTGAIAAQIPAVVIPRNDKFICEYCNKRFARKWNLKKHVQTIHQQEIIPEPNDPPIQDFKRKQQSGFRQPLFKSRKTDFDRWNVTT